MTPHERNELLRGKLHHAQTCGVKVNDLGLVAPSGKMWCVRCGHPLREKAAKSHRQNRCWSSLSFEQSGDLPVHVVEADSPSGCQRIIVLPPIVRARRPKAAPDPVKKLRDKRAAAEAMLTMWDRKLALAMTKVRQYRASVYRASRTLEAALSESRPIGRDKTRRIELD